MPLAKGSRLGPYEIKAPLGAGGMGEVYRAYDSRLQREVAVKVLHEDVARDPDRRRRFEREARAAAALGHPSIIAVFDVGEESGALYMVTELVPGEPLRARIQQGAMPVRKVLELAAQIADGLAAAHAVGITHRDLKPENIMVTSEDRVKILDFGLARLSEAPQAEDATQTMGTQAGVILGTVNYMSPEQARGLPVDYRSDQFSFGLILYELLSGKKAFQRQSAVETMAAIAAEDAPPVEGNIPAPLRWLIERCLAREAGRRYGSTQDLHADLRNLREHVSAAVQTASSPPTRPRARWQLAAGAVAVFVAGCLLPLLLRPRAGEIAAHRFTPFAIDPAGQEAAVWSRDGKAVVYASMARTESLMLRYSNSPVPIQIKTGRPNPYPIGWSADSKRIFFLSDSRNLLKKDLYVIAAVGGEAERLLSLNFRVTNPTVTVSPDGRAVAAWGRVSSDEPFAIRISSPVGSPWQDYKPDPFASRLPIRGQRLRFSPDGTKLLLWRNSGVREEAWLLPYPAGKETPRRVLEGLPQSYGGTPAFSWMPDSRHVVASLRQGEETSSHLWMADTESDDLRRLTSGLTVEVDPEVSPDGRKILYREERRDFDIVSVSLDDGSARKLIATDRSESMCSWAAARSKLAYVTDRNGPQEIWVRNEDGSDRPVATANDFPPGTRGFMSPSLSPEGDRVAFTRLEIEGPAKAWIVFLSGGSPVRLTDSQDDGEYGGSWSPDGTRFVYYGTRGIMVARIGSQEKPAVLREGVYRSAGGREAMIPEWSPTGEWITYRDSNGHGLVSPDGKTVRELGELRSPYLAFSKDGQRLYGIRAGTDAPKPVLFSLDLQTRKTRIIAELDDTLTPQTNATPGIPLSLAPDGNSLTYTVLGTFRSNLWLLEGFTQPGLRSRLRF